MTGGFQGKIARFPPLHHELVLQRHLRLVMYRLDNRRTRRSWYTENTSHELPAEYPRKAT